MSKRIEKKQQLEERITDLEISLSKLKRQLREEIENERHRDIDHLEEYLDEIDHRYTNLRGFWNIVRRELGDLFSGKKSAGGKNESE